jgi:uncharacterized protein YcgL (UPF0745 family)|tara:strand:+ start:2797 stop:3051 length:255 start_codon:yes stop_codon:yes gene_type:complete
MKIACDVYKSVDKENYYLYVLADQGVEQVPEALRQQLGKVEIALSLELTEEKSLAKEDPVIVMANLKEKGYHLQLPPAKHHQRG